MISKLLSSIKFSFNQIMSENKINIVILAADVIRLVLNALLLVVLPKIIVQQLLKGENNNALLAIVSFCIVLGCDNIITNVINARKKILSTNIKLKMDRFLGSTIMNMEYVELEKKEVLDNIHFAKKCIKQDSVIKMYQIIIDIVSGTITVIGMLYILFRLNIFIISVIVFSVIVSTIGEMYRLQFIFEREMESNEVERNLYYARNDLATNKYAKDIRLLNLHNFISKKVEKYSDMLCQIWAKTSMKSVKIIGWTYIVNGLQLVLVYSILAYMCYAKEIDVSEYIFYTTATIGFSNALKNIFKAFVSMISENKYIQGIVSLIKDDSDDEANEEMIRFEHDIEFQNVSFKYPGAKENSINNISLRINKGEKYALVGTNGAGKTTFVKLLTGMYRPTEGKILVDGIELNYRQISNFWNKFSCVFQDYNTYAFSIKDNIIFDNIKNDNEMNEIIRTLGLYSKIEQLNDGIDSLLNREINDNAIDFSGGEKQLLAIARALYKNSEIFVLDEPTAALSPQNEFKLYYEFNNMTKEKTVLYISHRLATCTLCDKIIVLDKGKIIEYGTHQELLNKNGMYKEMFEMQAKPYLNN